MTLRKATDIAQWTSVPFGQTSHQLDGQRSVMETWNASWLVNSLGVVYQGMPPGASHDLLCRQIADAGYKCVRTEVPFGVWAYDGSNWVNPAAVTSSLNAFAAHGLKPIILVNCHEGGPCPSQGFTLNLTQPAAAGATTVRATMNASVRLGYSGLSNLLGYWMAAPLITGQAANGDGTTTYTLSQPLPGPLPAGGVAGDTLKYRPFTKRGTDTYQETINGFGAYLDFMADKLNAQFGHGGWAIELYNELGFGFRYLDIAYYDPSQPSSGTDYFGIMADLGAYIAADHTGRYTGSEFINGFSNTVPWPSSGSSPAFVTGLCKHPYPSRSVAALESGPGFNVGADGKAGAGAPDCTYDFPELPLTHISTESILRDSLGPAGSSAFIDHSYDYSGGPHGRYGRGGSPVYVYVTETGMAPSERPGTPVALDMARGLNWKAKTGLRTYVAYNHAGVKHTCIFALAVGDGGLGQALDSWIAYASAPGAAYPADITPYLSPVQAAVRNLSAFVSAGLDPAATGRSLTIGAGQYQDGHGRFQFAGDGTAANPTLYNRDVFTFLPYQLAANAFVAPFYTQTRDSQSEIPGRYEYYQVPILGLRGSPQFTWYDPHTGETGAAIGSQDPRDGAWWVSLPTRDWVRVLKVTDVG